MREHGLARSNPDNGQGVYQFASSERRAACEGGMFTPGEISDEQFQIQTDCVAKFINESYGAGLDLNSDDGIKKLFFNYNGAADAYIQQALNLGFSQEEAENGEGSPYVMNRYDEQREPSETWGQIKKDKGPMEYPANNDFGAFVYYKAIADCSVGGGSSSGSSSDGDSPACTGEETNNLAQTAIELAWPLGTSDSKYKCGSHSQCNNNRDKAWPGYLKAIKKLGWTSTSKKWDPACNIFVGAVVERSGYDRKWNRRNTDEAVEYARKSDKWEVINLSGKSQKEIKAAYKSGDIVTYWTGDSGHIFMIAEVDGKLRSVESQYGHSGPTTWSHINTKNSKAKNCAKHSHCYIIRATKATNGTVNKDVGAVTSSGQNNGDIGASALELAWPEGTKEDVYQERATDKFAEYFSSLEQSKNDKGECYADGKSCDRFVGAAVRYSGVDPNMMFGRVGSDVLPYLEGNDNWEEVELKKPHSESSYQSGDVLLFYEGSNSLPSHIAIYAIDASGKGHIVQASYCKEFGVVKNTGSITGKSWSKIRAFRNKNNKNGGANCDKCKGNDGDIGLKDGGMTFEEAKEFMKAYRKEASLKKKGSYYFQKALVHDSGCTDGALNNCSAFSEWFVNRYTTAGPDVTAYQGSQTVKKLLELKKGFKDGGKVPAVYAVFSTGPMEGQADGWYNHTGVVLGIDQANNKIIVGEASCSNGFTADHSGTNSISYPNANVYDLKKWTNGASQYAPTYAYTDGILVNGGVQNAQ